MAATVTRLPTAAPRKVKNDRFAAQAWHARELRKAEPWPGPTSSPTMRQRHAAAGLIDLREAFSAEMIVAQAILSQLTPEQKLEAQNVAHRLYCEIGTDAARAASAFMASI